MKKLIYCALALAAGLFAASCQQENLEPVAQENTVTYTVELPGVQTKAFMGTVSKVDELIYEVWKTEAADERDLNGTSDNGNAKATLLYQKTVPMTNQRTVITLNLVQDQEYTVLFWAQKRGTGVYNTDALTDVHYAKTWNGSEDDANCLYSNQESYEAYYATEFISDGDKKSRTVVLKRPFAQLNLGTKNTQMENTGKEFGEGEYNVEVVSSKVTVSNVGTRFNVANNYVATPDKEASIAVTGESSVTFETATDPSNIEGDASSQFEYITVNGQKYEYVAMNYLFATGSNVTVSYEINTVLSDKKNTHTTEAKVTNTVYEVPLQENYRTNIVGNLLTSTSDYEVIVDPSWAGDDLAPDPLYLAASLGGEITLEQDYEFTAPFVVIKDLKINLNGHTIKGGKDYVSGAGLTAADISAITIDKNATLTIEGEGNIQGGEYAVTVKDGTFNGNAGNYIGNSTGIYVVDGTANLSGGVYEVRNPDSGRYFVVNCKDTSWNSGSSKVNITGGTYINFNPNEAWESQHTVNFLAEGYTVIPNVTDNGTEYTVVSGAIVTTTDEFKAAAQNPSLEYIIIASDLDFAGEKVVLTTDKIILGNDFSFNAGGGNAYAISIQGVEVSLQNLVMIDGGGIQLFNGADVTVKDVTVIPDYNVNSRHIFYVNNSNLTVESGSFEVTRTKSRYVAAEGNSEILIKGGVWADMVASGYAPLSIADGGNLSIIGGSFQVNVSTYKFDPTPYLADGYTTVREGDYLVVTPITE